MDAILETNRMLYNSVKDIVWVVSIEGKQKGHDMGTTLTAFVVGAKGLLMTCAHGDWRKWSGLIIRCRPLGTAEFRHRAVVSYRRNESDMCLLKVAQIEFCNLTKFGDGNLEVGHRVMYMGHPFEMVGLGGMGTVAYPCSEHAVFDYANDEKCETYVSESLDMTPNYAIMGHLWNIVTLEQQAASNSRPLDFEGNLMVHLPVILSSGLVGGKGASGAPIFNMNGELVGMFVAGIHGLDVGVHITAIKTFLECASAVSLAVQEDEEGVRRSRENVGKGGRSGKRGRR